MEGFTLVAYSSAAAGINAALTALAAVPDPHVRVVGNDIIVHADFSSLWGTYAVGVTLTRAQIQSPSLRRVVSVDIEPLDTCADLPGVPRQVFFRDAYPLLIDHAPVLD